MPDPKRFTITDADDQPHEYEVTPHPPTEGQHVMWKLVALGAKPLGNAVKGLLAMEGLAGLGSIKELLDDPDALVKLGAALDFGQLGEDLGQAVRSMPMAELTADILSRTTRDGKPLANRLAFDTAYACNYGELQVALWRVAAINRFLSLPGM